MFCCTLLYDFAIVLVGTGGAGCFAWYVFFVSRDCCVSQPRGTVGLSAVCDCGIS